MSFSRWAGNISADTISPPARGASLTRDVYGDCWYPEWNTDGNSSRQEGYRNTVSKDPNPGIWTAVGKTLSVKKKIAGLGEDRWDTTSILVFADDGTGTWVRFGAWTSEGGGELSTNVATGVGSGKWASFKVTSDPQDQLATIDFPIPPWAKGRIKWEIWARYGAVSNITNWQWNPQSSSWVNHKHKSHLAVAYGDTGIEIRSIKPVSPSFRSISSIPSGFLSPSVDSINLGASFEMNVSAVNVDMEHSALVGDGANIKSPANRVFITPSSTGVLKYVLSAPILSTLKWEVPNPEDRIRLVTPSGESVDVTSRPGFSYVVTAGHEGTYQLIETSPFGVDSNPATVNVKLNSFTTTATITVTAPASMVSVAPQAASYTVPTGPAAGHTYRRSWNDGANWHAYLGRDGVSISVQALDSNAAITSIELQCKAPNGDWTDLASPRAVDGSQPNGAGVKVSQTFSVRLGRVRSDKPLVPSDPSLAGVWQLRARSLNGAGHWSDWSASVPLAVEMPLQNISKTGQTLPPLKDAEWFNASAVKTYNLNLWVP